MRDGYQWKRGYLDRDETARLRTAVLARSFAPVRVKAGMNLPYQVIDGERLARELPEIHALATGPIRDAVEAAVGEPIELMRDPRRAIRVQRYRSRDEGFRWHLDGGRFGALLTLENDADGVTEVLSPRASRWAAPVAYLLFPFPRLLERAGPTALAAAPGDLLVLDGGRIVHRGTNRRHGDRMVLAASYDPLGTRRPRLKDWLARRLNY